MVLRKPEDFIQAGLIAEKNTANASEVAEKFSLAMTDTMHKQIQQTPEHDPIAKQFVPRAEELLTTTQERVDPIGDEAHKPIKGIIHRHKDRCLLIPISVCAVYCRFCFRREKIGPGNEALSPDELNAALDYIETHTEIWEVILTGGDPLLLKPKQLAILMKRLDAIKHVESVRFHTRIPLVDPARIDMALLTSIKLQHKPTYIVLHVNHANEFSKEGIRACNDLIDAGFPMLSQTVLLKEINNNVETLEQLMRTLIRHRIKPYYLHHADLAQGTSHFRTSIAEGQEIIKALRARVSGICLPQYVLDIPGGFGKIPIQPNYIKQTEEGNYLLEDHEGAFHLYF